MIPEDERFGYANGFFYKEELESYARQEAIEFATWLPKNGYDLLSDLINWQRFPSDECRSTEELYELFLQSKNKDTTNIKQVDNSNKDD